LSVAPSLSDAIGRRYEGAASFQIGNRLAEKIILTTEYAD
jgi:hypothetical protein